MKTISTYWLIPVVIIAIIATYLYIQYVYVPSETISVNKRKQFDVITYTLPVAVDPVVFGPKYWKAFHHLTERIPCIHCRNKAEPFMRFFHDVVNKNTDKPIFDKENYNKHIDYIGKLDKA